MLRQFHWKLEYMSNWAMYASATSFTGSWNTCQTGPCMPAPPLSLEVGVHVKLGHVCQRHLFHGKLEYMSNWVMYASATSFTGSWSTCQTGPCMPAPPLSLEVGVHVKLGHVCQRHLFHGKLEYMSNWAMYASATSFTGSWSTCQTGPYMPAPPLSLEVGVHVKLGHVCQRHLFHWKLEYMSNWAMYASATSFTGSWSTCQTEPCMPAPPRR